MRVLIASDVFPPKCSGSGWSSYYLSRELRRLGHEISVLRPRFVDGDGKARVVRTDYDGLPLAELHIPTGKNPLACLVRRNVLAPRLLRRFTAAEAERTRADVIHGQHMLTIPAAVAAAAAIERTGPAPATVSTVRDYWPVSHFTTMYLEGRDPLAPGTPCPDCGTLPGLARGLVRAEGPRAAAKLPLTPLWHSVALQRRAALRRADATIAVSNYVARVLLDNNAVLPDRLHVVPNLVDVARVAEIVAAAPPFDSLGLKPGEDFLLFAGKLDPHKGAQLLPPALHKAGIGKIPLVVAGEGPLREKLIRDCYDLGIDLRLADWLGNEDVLRLMHHCTVLLLPSVWQEPLSRILLEGTATAAAILALDTGGTRDAIEDGVSGALAADMDDFATRLARLLAAPAERAVLRRGALATARARFDGSVVAAQVISFYQDVTSSASRKP